EEPGVTLACINGGYFGGNQSYSLVKYNNTVFSANIKALTRSFNGSNTSYFPTRAAFGVSSTGAPSVAWVYHVGSGNDLIYSYPSPSPNALGLPPQPVPDANFPAGGTQWNTVSAIGGSPVLIKNDQIRISDAEELIDINNTSSRPRSAIGYQSNGMVLMLAVEGDNAPDYPGINLANLAALLKALGCTEAINLDGGGSTSLVVSGTRTVRPSNGTERAVPSVVLIKRK
ncbi:MAG: phosphodiester glycosidase family protein, partial [Chitinophagaceae bacterium]